MGRIKTKQIKRVTRDFMKMHGDKLGKDFVENKVVVDRFSVIRSKKLRNTIAGYATRLSKL